MNRGHFVAGVVGLVVLTAAAIGLRVGGRAPQPGAHKPPSDAEADAANTLFIHYKAHERFEHDKQVERDALCSIGLGTCPVEFRCTAELQRWVGFYRGHLDAATADAVFLASRIWPGNDATCSDQPSSTITRKDVEAMLRAKAGAP